MNRQSLQIRSRLSIGTRSSVSLNFRSVWPFSCLGQNCLWSRSLAACLFTLVIGPVLLASTTEQCVQQVTGRYRFNTLLEILQHDYSIKNVYSKSSKCSSRETYMWQPAIDLTSSRAGSWSARPTKQLPNLWANSSGRRATYGRNMSAVLSAAFQSEPTQFVHESSHAEQRGNRL
jgi:hypothetical protein